MYRCQSYMRKFYWYSSVIVGYLLFRLIQLTCRITYIDEHQRQNAYERSPHDQAYLLASWHEHIVPLVISQRKYPLCALVSQSGGGQIVGWICRLFGYQVIFGSQARDGRDKGGLRALLRLRRKLHGGLAAALTVDGSIGPPHEVKAGIIELARSSGCPVLPFGCHIEHYWELKTWDRMKIPKPFSRIRVALGEPIMIPAVKNKNETKWWQEHIAAAISATSAELNHS